jgi:dimethylhistidine N-methyltransferase
MAAGEGLALVELDDDGVATAFRGDVLAGLAQPQKAVPARWLYDDAGSALFEEITRLPEYYPTRAETEILSERCGEFRELIGPGRAVIEFGSGSSVKTPLLLGCIEPAAYVPLDISGDFLRAAADDLAAKFPGLPVYPVEADFMREVALPAAVRELPKLGFFPGSTIGNMVARTAVDLLRSMRATLGEGSQLLIGMDLIKDVAVLEAAYDDAQGVTAEFNLNLARRINRELGGTLPLDRLRHVARWNDTYARIEMHLEATDDIDFEVSGRRFTLARGETIHTENSHKFDLRSQNTLLLAGGWTPARRWLDGEGRFSLILADWTIPRGAP